MNNKYEPQNEKFYIRFWGNVEEKVIYKFIFVLMYGLGGALSASLLAVLMLRDVDFKWKLVYIGSAFTVSIMLSPFGHKRFKKKYREYENFIKATDSQGDWFN